MSRAIWQPVLRSRKKGHHEVSRRDAIKIGLITWLLPAALTWAGVGLFRLLGLSYGTTGMSAGDIALFLLLGAPVPGLLVVPFLMLAGRFLLSRGYAGWIVALIPPVLAALLEQRVLVPTLTFHLATLWIAARWIRPSAFLPAASD